MLTRHEIGGRAAQEIGAGMVVKLGIGTPAPAGTSTRPELGAMDLVFAPRRLAVLTTTRDSGGGPKLVRRRTLPRTTGFELVEVAPGVDVEGVRDATGAALQVSPRPWVADAGADPALATEGGRV